MDDKFKEEFLQTKEDKYSGEGLDKTALNSLNEYSQSEASRRDFLKKVFGAVTAFTAATMIPSATGFSINSNKGLKYFDSNNKQQFSVNAQGTANIDYLGTSDSPIQTLDVKELHSKSNTPNIIVYEDEKGQAKAIADSGTYSGSDIFEAAQKAIDNRLDQNREGLHDGTNPDSGDIDVFIKPGKYSVSSRIVIGQTSTERVYIRSSGTHGAYIDTSNYQEGEFVIEVNPEIGNNGDLVSGDYSERDQYVGIHGLFLDHTASRSMNESGERVLNRDADGIRLNDVSEAEVTSSRIIGYGCGIWLQNLWQPSVENLWVNQCGDDSKPLIPESAVTNNENAILYKPQIAIGHPKDTDTNQALNHLRLDFLQGDPRNSIEGVPYMETFGRVSKCHMSNPTIELPEDSPGIVIGGEGANAGTWKITNGHIPKGSPSIRVETGDVKISNSTTGPIEQVNGYSSVMASNLNIQAGSETGWIQRKGSDAVLSNVTMRNPAVGIDCRQGDEMVVNGLKIYNCTQEAIRSTILNGLTGATLEVNGLISKEGHEDASEIINIQSKANSLRGDIFHDIKANPSSSVPIFRIEDLIGFSISNVLGLENVSALAITSGTVEGKWNNVTGGGPLGGIDLSSASGQYDGEKALSAGATANSEDKPYSEWRWDKKNSKWVDGRGNSI